ncbi:OmpA family protein [Foetidibacter luteolus]|uniref:OmpA family protein n=1 Tax=Foetidibacter luteolus TaxID=2608880 RepID=UPI001A98C8F5|nr:OmpA family protein [Foetidibacter luteolus]
MSKKLIVLCLFFKPFMIFGQNSSLIYQLRFERNKFEITQKNKQILSLICDTLSGKDNYLIYINGHTDSDADSSYNQQLSMKRSLSVKKFLVEKGIKESLLSLQAMGEEQPLVANTAPLEKAKNRRVEVLVVFQKKHDEKFIEVQKELIATRDNEDTSVTLENGFKLILSKQDWNKNKNCLRVKKLLFYKFYVEENWLKKHIGFKNYRKIISYEPQYQFSVISCTDSCFENSLKLYIPYYEAIGLKNGIKYSQKRKSKQGSIKLSFGKAKFGDSIYYKADVYCPGTINCGTDNRCTHPITLYAKNDISILSYSYNLRSSSTYFDSLIEVKPINSKRITENYNNAFFHRLTFISNRDTIILKNIPVDVFAHGWKKIKTLGAEYDMSYFMFIPFRKKYTCGHYKKYKIRKKDIENLKQFDLNDLEIENN